MLRDKASRPYLVVRAGATFCGLPVDRIRKVVRALPVHGIAGSNPVLLGLSQLDGEPIGVLDLGRLVGVGATGTTEHGVTVVAAVGPHDRLETVGLAADEALQIARYEIEEQEILQPKSTLSERPLGDRIVKLLDLSRLQGEGR